MKSIALSALLFIISISLEARAKIPYCGPCENLTTIYTLPDTSQIVTLTNEKLNVGYKYNVYGILWIPLWTDEGKIVLVNKKEDTYSDITEAELNELKKNVS